MAQMLRIDGEDFAAYLLRTEPAVKVRKASEFSEELLASFNDPKDTAPEMFSTKLRGLLRFRPGEVTAWTGYNGHRKSMFTGQVALDLCVQRQRVLMMSLEMRPEMTLHRMARQASAQRNPAPAWLKAFTAWTDKRLWLFDHLGRISPDLCIAVCRYFAEELRGQQVVIDSMMMVCASEESMDEQKQFTTDLVRVAQETGLHIHLVTHCRKPAQGEDKPPGKYDLRGSAAISDQAANVVTVWANKAKLTKLQEQVYDLALGAEPDALVSVEKQRNGEFEGRVKLWFSPQSMRFSDDRTSQVEPYEILTAREAVPA